MTVLECYQYINNRLNKLSTNAGDNIPKFQFVEAFNAVQDQWVEARVKLNDTNTVRIDELQPITIALNIVPIKNKDYSYISLPDDYYHIKRIIGYLPCPLYAYPAKESDVNRLLSDEFWKPSIEWEETFYTIMNNQVRVYGDFNIPNLEIIYYRTPRRINMVDGYNGLVTGEPNTDIDPEFKNASLLEILNETVVLLASDVMDVARFQSISQRVAQNT